MTLRHGLPGRVGHDALITEPASRNSNGVALSSDRKLAALGRPYTADPILAEGGKRGVPVAAPHCRYNCRAPLRPRGPQQPAGAPFPRPRLAGVWAV